MLTFSFRRVVCLGASALAVAWLATAGWAADRDPARGAHIVFVIGEREYQTAETLPQFAKKHLQPLGLRCSFVFASSEDPNEFPGLEVLREGDLLFLSVRRRALRREQLELVRSFLQAGKPLVGIRTASHAFALRRGQPPPGHAVWPDFDVQVLGGHYEGHFRNYEGTEVTTVAEAERHEILAGIHQRSFHSGGTLYKYTNLSPDADVLLRGTTKVEGQPVQMPVAWTHHFGKSRVFYTSLGHKEDFQNAAFTRLLTNAVLWCLGRPVPAGPQ